MDFVMGGEASTIPLPPPDFHERTLPIVSIPRNDLYLYRCHKVQSRHTPQSYNFNKKVDSRFNAPSGEFGILYMGCDPFCAFIESIGHDFILGEHRLVSEGSIQERCICHFRIDERVNNFSLVNLTDGSAKGYGSLNLDNQITTSKDRAVTRQWALAFWKHDSKPDGIIYRACNDVSRLSIAMFNRAGDVFTPGCQNNLLADRHRLAEILDHYDVGLDDEVHDLE